MEINKMMRDYMSIGYGIREAKELADYESVIKEQISKEKIVIQVRSFKQLPRKKINSGTVFSTNCIDHLGNTYPTVSAMTKHYGKTVFLYEQRLSLGWSKERALTTPVRKVAPQRVDHLGNKFKTLTEMLDHYHINENVYYRRFYAGWSLEKILTTPYKPRNKDSK